jgi:anthranilate synthase component 1
MAEFSLERVYDIAEELGYPCIIPLVRVVRTELEPTDVYASLRKTSKLSFLLESAEIGEKIARYSFLGNSPEKLITLKDGVLNINGEEKSHVVEPMEELRKLLAGYRVYENRLPRFHGGLLGYFSYDLIRYIEKIGENVKDDLKHNDAEFMLVRDLITYDHWRDEVLLISNLMLQSEEEIRGKYRAAKERINELEKIVASAKPLRSVRKEGRLKVKSNFNKREFIKAVETAKEYIYAGDIFQVVLSQRFECSPKAEPFEIYLSLKEVNPSPYMYFLELQDLKIIGSSPEILVKAEGKKVTVRPIAGTRPRGMDVVEDEALAREMLNDPKERAEHVMLVDLGRNDVGKVSRFGSVEVNEFMATEKYSHVQHIVSNVVGELREDKDAFDAIEASFPAGTVSGAPKVRAMEIIEELEPTKRGIYAGCVGYFSFDRSMDFAITIRTIVMHGERAYVQAGAGIVADSVPEGEYQETVNKGKAMLKAIRLAGG